MSIESIFQPWLSAWNLLADGDPIVTPAAHLLPVVHQGSAAMLKVSSEADERTNWVLLEWWDGDGAARLLERNGDAILIERAHGLDSLSDMARTGRDDQATLVLCDTLAELHRSRHKRPPVDLIPLIDWFKDLAPAAAAHGGLLTSSLAAANRLLVGQQDIGVLHGDLHHDNVLDFGPRGWLAIDPKRLLGDRAFDHAIMFGNPDLADPTRPIATLPGVFERRLELVIARSGLERDRLLDWIIAWTGLSAAWLIDDGDDPWVDLQIAEQAIAVRAR